MWNEPIYNSLAFLSCFWFLFERFSIKKDHFHVLIWASPLLANGERSRSIYSFKTQQNGETENW